VKITIFGLTLSSSWGNGHATPYRALLRALARMGHSITFYEKDVPYYARHRDFSSCDFCELFIYQDWDSIRERALHDAAGSDVVLTASFLPQGAQINDELLALPRPLHVFYDLDTPVTLGLLRQGKLVDYLLPAQLSAFDLVFSFTGGACLNELRERYGVRNAQPLYGCVDPDVHFRVEVPEQYRCALSYMGTYAADRQPQLEKLLLAPARQLPQEAFVLAGSLYPWDGSIAWPPNLRRFEHVGPSDHAAFYSSSRATLNITRADMAANGYCPSGRFFEAAACDTPVLTDSWLGLGEFFLAGEEIIVVSSTAEVVEALRRPAAELTQIAARARARTLSEHTGEVRARQMLAALEAARSSTPAQPSTHNRQLTTS